MRKDPGAHEFWKHLPVYKHGVGPKMVKERLRMAEWWASKSYLVNADDGEKMWHKDKKWIFENVVFIDPISYLIKTPSTRSQVETQMGATSRKGWMSKSKQTSSSNRPRNQVAVKQKSTGDIRWYMLYVLWRGKNILIHIGPDKTKQGSGFKEVKMVDGTTSAGFAEDHECIEKLFDSNGSPMLSERQVSK